MTWVVHYRDEINKRDVISSDISTRQAAMDQACLLLRERFTVSQPEDLSITEASELIDSLKGAGNGAGGGR